MLSILDTMESRLPSTPQSIHEDGARSGRTVHISREACHHRVNDIALAEEVYAAEPVHYTAYGPPPVNEWSSPHHPREPQHVYPPPLGYALPEYVSRPRELGEYC